MHKDTFVHWFREAAPFVNAHRGQTVVVHVGGALVASNRFDSLLHDLALINALGVRLVIVHGTRPQVTAHLHRSGGQDHYHAGLRVTDSATLLAVKETAGATRVAIEAALSRGMVSSSGVPHGVRVASGNFIIARPLGVHDGIDFQYTGSVRRVDTAAINALLAQGTIVVISPLGYSATGEVFNLGSRDTAVAVAAELRAAKLILLSEAAIIDASGNLLRQLTLKQASELRDAGTLAGPAADALAGALQACQLGVARAHVIGFDADGTLVRELFTRDGTGTMISESPFDLLREATIDDVGGILELIEPLERDGTLVRRSREKLEQEIAHFSVLVREGTIIACGALYPFSREAMGEIACIAVHPDYQRAGFGDALMARLEAHAREQHLNGLFVLTTQALHWFIERGYQKADIGDLPMARQAMYNFQRNSQVLTKKIDA